MRLIRAKNYEEMSNIAAVILAEQICQNPSIVLGLATGSTPELMYHRLKNECQAGFVDFSKARSYNLDEYVGLGADDPQSYRMYMQKHLFSGVNIRYDMIEIPNGVSEDLDEECKRYDASIAAAGGIDLLVLGIGENGHVGFNEPNEHYYKDTHVVELRECTIHANSRFFSDISIVPKRAITMGMGAIMRARRIVMLAAGNEKAGAVAQAVTGPIMPSVPASLLQLHPNVTVIADMDALSIFG